MKTMRCSLFTLCGTLAVLNPISVRAQTANPQPAGETKTACRFTLAAVEATKADKPVKLSWGLDEIVKLSQARLDESVILAFIEHSQTAYNPTAQDIVQLRELGVSSQIITALMRHGGALRQTARESQEQVQAERAAAVAAATTPPACQTTAVSRAPVSTVTYIGYPRYYSYPANSYGWYAPGYYYPRSFAYGCYPGFSFGVRFGGGYHGRYHSWNWHCR